MRDSICGGDRSHADTDDSDMRVFAMEHLWRVLRTFCGLVWTLRLRALHRLAKEPSGQVHSLRTPLGFDHGAGHPLPLLCNAKASNY